MGYYNSYKDEPHIPSAMEDWDEAFWIATGIVVPMSHLDFQERAKSSYMMVVPGLRDAFADVKPGTPIRLPTRW